MTERSRTRRGVGTLAGSIYRRIPADRRVRGLVGVRGRRMLQVRSALGPTVGRFPVRLVAPDGTRYHCSTDPIDALVVKDLVGASREVWLPSWIDDVAPTRIFDIGGHHGLFAVSIARRLPQAFVVCVEPSAAGCALIERNVDLNGLAGRMAIVRAGLGSDGASATLYHDPEGSWGNSTHPLDDPTAREEIVLRSLDDLVAEFGTPDFIKCNAEGAEYELIPQLEASTVRSAGMVIMAHHEFGDVDDVVNAAGRMGYEVTSVGTDARPAFHMRRT